MCSVWLIFHLIYNKVFTGNCESTQIARLLVHIQKHQAFYFCAEFSAFQLINQPPAKLLWVNCSATCVASLKLQAVFMPLQSTQVWEKYMTLSGHFIGYDIVRHCGSEVIKLKCFNSLSLFSSNPTYAWTPYFDMSYNMYVHMVAFYINSVELLFIWKRSQSVPKS